MNRLLTMIMLLIMPVAATVAASQAPIEMHAEHVELCSIVKDPKQFTGKRVEVSGELWIGSGGIFNDKCEPMVTQGHVWPKGLHLSPARESAIMARAIQEAKQAGKRNVCVTVIGTVEAKEKYLIITTPDGRRLGDGFGHLNAFPGQLRVIKVVRAGICDPKE